MRSEPPISPEFNAGTSAAERVKQENRRDAPLDSVFRLGFTRSSSSSSHPSRSACTSRRHRTAIRVRRIASPFKRSSATRNKLLASRRDPQTRARQSRVKYRSKSQLEPLRRDCAQLKWRSPARPGSKARSRPARGTAGRKVRRRWRAGEWHRCSRSATRRQVSYDRPR